MSSNDFPQAQMADGTRCCPRFDPGPWRERLLTWDHKLFVHDRVHSVLHVPLDFGKVMSRNIEAIGDALAPDGLVLCDEDSPWGTNVFLAVNRPVRGREMAEISGTFLATVYEGPYRQVSQFSQAAVAAAELKGIRADRVYSWYPTCPRCAKAYGENYVVIFAGSSG